MPMDLYLCTKEILPKFLIKYWHFSKSNFHFLYKISAEASYSKSLWFLSSQACFIFKNDWNQGSNKSVQKVVKILKIVFNLITNITDHLILLKWSNQKFLSYILLHFNLVYLMYANLQKQFVHMAFYRGEKKS